MENRKALLVIDMQKGSFTPKTPRHDTVGVVKRINELAELFRELGYPVVYIQHDGTGTGEFEKNATDWENLDDLTVESKDVRIDKYANDVFYKSDLHSKLKELNEQLKRKIAERTTASQSHESTRNTHWIFVL